MGKTMTWGEFKAAVDAAIEKAGLDSNVAVDFIVWHAGMYKDEKRPVDLILTPWEGGGIDVMNAKP